jgi:hypothetical protein
MIAGVLRRRLFFLNSDFYILHTDRNIIFILQNRCGIAIVVIILI